MSAAEEKTGLVVGRYVIFDEIAAGGMATVHLGRQVGAVGFARTVAVKRLHANLSRDEDFTSMFLDEARLAARIRHPNVVQVLDVVHESGELFLVMDYVQGESLSRLWRMVKPGVIPPRIAVTAIAGVLHGLHAAHEATTEHGDPLRIVHRDVSPQNVMVGTDGVARVLDFGVAKAANRASTTRDGALKGKISYMAPEQLLSESIDRRADIYAVGVVLWETLTGQRLFDGDNQGRVVRKILDEEVQPPSSVAPGLPKALDTAIMKAIERDPNKRFQTAREFAAALERSMPPASLTEIGEWVESLGGGSLAERARRVKEIESRTDIHSGNVTAATILGREPVLTGPTVPQAFAVMSTDPDAIDFPSEPPPPAPSAAPKITVDTDPMPISGMRSAKDVPIDPSRRSPSRKLQVPSPFAPMPVQTLSIGTPLASLDPVPVPIVKPTPSDPIPTTPPPPQRSSRAGRVILWLFVLLVLAGGGAAAWFFSHGRHWH